MIHINLMRERSAAEDKALDIAIEIVTLELGLITSKNKDEFLRRGAELMESQKGEK